MANEKWVIDVDVTQRRPNEIGFGAPVSLKWHFYENVLRYSTGLSEHHTWVLKVFDDMVMITKSTD